MSSLWTKYASNQMFGVPLHELQSRHTQLVNVPRVITDCVQYLRLNGMAEVGLFRQSGSESRLEEWQLYYDEGYAPVFDEGTPHDVATLLKRRAHALLFCAHVFCLTKAIRFSEDASWGLFL